MLQLRRWARGVLLAGLLVAPAAAQDDPETVAAQKVERARAILAEMATAVPDRVYALGAELRELAGDEDPVLRVVAEGLHSERPEVVLACGGIVLPDYGEREPLLRLVRAGGLHAPWAAGVLGRTVERKDLAELAAILADEAARPDARRAAAAGLLQRDAADAAAVAYCTRALEEGPEAVTRAMALTLAEAGHVASVRRILAAIATEPTVEGATARAYLGLEPLRASVTARRTDLSGLADEVARKVLEFYPHATAPDGKTAVDLPYCRDAAARGMLAELDQFCEWLTLDDFRQNEERMRGSYGGIGAYVQMRPYRGDPGAEPRDALTISQPIYRHADDSLTPAYTAGIRSGDQVVRCLVPEHEGEIELLGKPLQECVDLLKGTPGTAVTVWVRSRGHEALRQLTLSRATIEIDTTPGGMLPGDVGYCRILRFDNKTGRTDLKRRLMALRDAGAKGLIIDLRSNPGGSLTEVVQCADWFLRKDAVVTTLKGRHANWRDEVYAAKSDPLWTRPVVLLTNEESASGAELFPGALRDHGVATVIGAVGDQKPTGATFGKGSGQTFLPLDASVQPVEGRPMPTRLVRLTVFKYYLPRGESVHKTGLVPDVALVLPELPEWQVEATEALLRTEAVGLYVDGLVARAARDSTLLERLMTLATFDGFDPAAYPGLAEWAKTLATPLDAEALRRLVRAELRLQLADVKAREFLFDFQEDLHLQRAIREVRARLGAVAEVPEYAHIAAQRFSEFRPREGETAPAPR